MKTVITLVLLSLAFLHVALNCTRTKVARPRNVASGISKSKGLNTDKKMRRPNVEGPRSDNIKNHNETTETASLDSFLRKYFSNECLSMSNCRSVRTVARYSLLSRHEQGQAVTARDLRAFSHLFKFLKLPWLPIVPGIAFTQVYYKKYRQWTFYWYTCHAKDRWMCGGRFVSTNTKGALETSMDGAFQYHPDRTFYCLRKLDPGVWGMKVFIWRSPWSDQQMNWKKLRIQILLVRIGSRLFTNKTLRWGQINCISGRNLHRDCMWIETTVTIPGIKTKKLRKIELFT
jgi:hypothetical protein